jgi:flagellum-specific peptidoglycan hydrolase FlgJ
MSILDDILQDMADSGKLSPEQAMALGASNPNPWSSVRAPVTDIEYEFDMQNALNDPLSQLGYQSVGAGGWNTGAPNQDEYNADLNQIYIDPKPGDVGREVQAHEYRHGGMERLIDAVLKDGEAFRKLYGDDASEYMWDLLEQPRGGNSSNEKMTEMFENPVEGIQRYREYPEVDLVQEYMAKGPDAMRSRGQSENFISYIADEARKASAINDAAAKMLILEKEKQRKKMDPANDPKIVLEGYTQPLNSGYGGDEYKYADGGRVGGSKEEDLLDYYFGLTGNQYPSNT